MDEKKNNLALQGLLGAGMSGCLNNLTEQEKKKADEFLNSPDEAECLNFGNGKRIRHPVAVSRIKRITEEHGIEALEIFYKFFFGIPADGQNTPIKFKDARDLTEKILKGGT